MILFSAEAIFASSNSKSGPGVPLMERDDLRSSTDSTISTSLTHSTASVGNCEQAHTSVLNLIFQQANVVWVGNLSKWSSEICSCCWSALYSFENLPSLGSNEFLADGPDWHLGSKVVSGVWRSLRYMRWCVFRYVKKSKDWILLDKVMKRTLGESAKTFPDIPCVFQISGGLLLRLGISHRTASHPSRITKRWELTRVVWEDCSPPKCLTPHSRKYALGLLIEPTHMEAEDEEQENEKEDERRRWESAE